MIKKLIELLNGVQKEDDVDLLCDSCNTCPATENGVFIHGGDNCEDCPFMRGKNLAQLIAELEATQ